MDDGGPTEIIDGEPGPQLVFNDRKISLSLTALLASGGDHMAGRGKEKE